MTDEGSRTREVASFGPFKLIAAERLLEKAGVPVHLGARAFDILIALVERAGEVISKKELMARVWSDVTVDEGSLRFQIVALRKALGDGQSGARYVSTLAGRGYCFVAPVSHSSAARPVAAENPVLDQPQRLPSRLMRMVGRDDAVREISARLRAQRFVTIVGPGGMGKTTVAVSVGHMQLADFEGAVFFFDLGPLNDPLLLPSAVASTLGLLVQSSDPTPGLIMFLRDKRMLLILDSCEHVVESAAALAEQIFREAPQVHILATSREALRAEGEHVQHLSPLESPPDDAGLTAAQVMSFPAAQLFVERAAANDNRFELNDTDAPTVGEICRRLDGIALALELAAGRVNAHGVQGTAELLNKRFNLLWRGRRSAPPRHRTLSATLDWSHDLLPERERGILRRLSIFVGAFTLEAARSVAAGDDVEEEDVAAAIASLVAKSLVAADTGGITPRYRLLDTTRGYALGKLVESGAADSIARNHAIYYCGVLEGMKADSSPLFEAPLSYAEHLDNVRAALEWSFSHADSIELGTVLAAASAPLFFQMSLLDECHGWAKRAILALDDATRGTRQEMELQATLGLSLMFGQSNSEEALVALTRGLELAEALADLPNQLRLLGRLHLFHYRTGDFRTSLVFAQRSKAVAEEMTDPMGIAAAHSLLGISHHLIEDLVAARMHLEAALVRIPGSPRINIFHFGLDYRNRAGICLARTLWVLGYPDQAAKVARQTVEEAATLDHPVTLCIALIWAVSVFLWSGDWASAEESIDRLVAHARRRSLVPYEAAGLGVKGYLLVKRDDAEAGIQLLNDSIEALRAYRYELLATALNSTLAEGLAMTGQRAQSLKKIDETIALVERNGDLFNIPELLRIKGDILASAAQADLPQAETCFLRSLELAKHQSALAWELRTATSLAHFWSRQGRFDEACRLLAPVYDRFTEGFESHDLKAARHLLEELGALAARRQG